MICGEFPFTGNNIKQIGNSIKKKDPNYKHKKIMECSPEFLKLLKGLLEKDKNKRFTIDDALSSEWFNESSKSNENILDDHFKDKMFSTMQE
mmetsp:Transcript_16513/g.13534  ORF Transcript_16513/g.13534 Transcript_16513/m.13534 type:complete len:92 (-) Transcript_16513:579-854(-)